KIARLGSGDEGCKVIVRTRGGGQAIGNLIEPDPNHTRWSREGFGVVVSGQGDGALHKFGPDGRGGISAAQAQVAVIVISNPDDAKQVAGVSGEPGIMRGAGFAGGR